MNNRLAYLSVLSALCLLFAGCATQPPQQVAGKSLVTIAATVDHAMQGWAKWAVQQRANPAADQAQLLRNEGAVSRAYEQYQAAMRVARVAYREATTDPLADQTALDAAIRAVNAAQSSLLGLISTLSQ